MMKQVLAIAVFLLGSGSGSIVHAQFIVQVKEYYNDRGEITDQAHSSYYLTGKRVVENGPGVKNKLNKSGPLVDTVKIFSTATGQLLSVERFATGQLDGLATYYYPSGKPRQRGAYAKGILVGSWMQWYPQGEKHFELEFSGKEGAKGKLISYWDSTGRPSVQHGNGICSCYGLEENPQLHSFGMWKEGVRDSVWMIYRGKELLYASTYHNGDVTDSNIDEEKIWTVVEQQPEFPGGMEAMMMFLQQNIKYPATARRMGTEGRVFIGFVVQKDGSLSDITVVKGISPGLDEEAKRVLRSMPPWNPGKQNGKLVRARFVLPVNFKLR